MSTETEEFRYAAFISYRHAEPDRSWAKWLHRSLETYPVPRKVMRERGLPPRVGRCFRDEEELPASAELKTEIDTALRQSRFLIVVCSPRTPESLWVNKEVERFREWGRHDRILALLIEGEPAQSFPPALREIRTTVTDAQGLTREQVEQVEPLAADVRLSRTEGQSHLKRMAKLRLLAVLLGVRFDDLRQREQERRTRQLRLVTLGMAVLLAIISGAGIYAWVQRNDAIEARELARQNELAEKAARQDEQKQRQAAERERKEAQRQARRAETREAEGLVREGDARGLARQWVEAEAAYMQSMSAFTALKLPAFTAEVGLWDVYRSSPPPMYSLPQEILLLNSVSISGDGRFALTGGNNAASLWDLVLGQEVDRLQLQGDFPVIVDTVAISVTGRTALTGSRDGLLRLWDLQNGTEIRQMQHGGWVTSAAYCPDNRTGLTAGNDGLVKHWDLLEGRLLRTFKAHKGAALTVAPSPDPDSPRALSGGQDDIIRLWDLSSPEGNNSQPLKTLDGHGGDVTGLGFLPTGDVAVSCSHDATLRLWDLDAGRNVGTFLGHDDAVNALSLHPLGAVVLSGGADRSLRLWDLTGRPMTSFGWHTAPVLSVALSPDGAMRAMSGSEDMTFKLWHVDDTADERSLWGHEGPAYAAAISNDGLLALTGGEDRTVRLWDAATGKELRHLAGHQGPVTDVAFSPDGARAASAAGDNTVRVWDLASGAELLNTGGLDFVASAVAFSPDGRLLLIGGGEFKTHRLFDIESGQDVFPEFPRHGVRLDAVAFSPDGQTFATGGEGGTVKLWSVATGKEVRSLGQAVGWVRGLVFSPDGLRLACGTDGGQVWIWDLSDKTGPADGAEPSDEAEAAANERHAAINVAVQATSSTTPGELTFAAHVESARGVAFGPAGRTLVTCGQDGSLRLWDVSRPGEVRELRGFPRVHERGAWSVALTPDGHVAISTGSESGTGGAEAGTVLVWDFGRSLRYKALQQRAADAQAALAADRTDANALAALGEWYAFRGVDDWAVELLESARQGGADVPALTLARCYWRLENLEAARKEFESALERGDEATQMYLRLCVDALTRATADESGE